MLLERCWAQRLATQARIERRVAGWPVTEGSQLGCGLPAMPFNSKLPRTNHAPCLHLDLQWAHSWSSEGASARRRWRRRWGCRAAAALMWALARCGRTLGKHSGRAWQDRNDFCGLPQAAQVSMARHGPT